MQMTVVSELRYLFVNFFLTENHKIYMYLENPAIWLPLLLIAVSQHEDECIVKMMDN